MKKLFIIFALFFSTQSQAAYIELVELSPISAGKEVVATIFGQRATPSHRIENTQLKITNQLLVLDIVSESTITNDSGLSVPQILVPFKYKQSLSALAEGDYNLTVNGYITDRLVSTFKTTFSVPDFSDPNVAKVPAPAIIWLLIPAIGLLLGRRKRLE